MASPHRILPRETNKFRHRGHRTGASTAKSFSTERCPQLPARRVADEQYSQPWFFIHILLAATMQIEASRARRHTALLTTAL